MQMGKLSQGINNSNSKFLSQKSTTFISLAVSLYLGFEHLH